MLTGELAALGTAFCWACGTLLFTFAGRLIGSYNVNKLRIPIAMIFLATLLLVQHGTLFPSGLNNRALIYLSASGIIGLTLGDTFYFRCLVILGSRLGALMMSLAPVMTALFAFILIGEHLSALALTGIAVTLSGVAWVATDKKENRIDSREGSKPFGLLMGFLGASGQALGLVLAKEAMDGVFDATSATFIRMAAASVTIWIWAALRGESTRTLRQLKVPKALLSVSGAAFLGPTVGVTLSLVAVKYAQAGVAATIMSTFPIIVIPLAFYFNKERPTWRSIVGSIIAIAGVALLFLE